MRHGGPLGDAAVDVGSPEGRADILPLRREASRNDQHRHVLGKRLRDAREGILDAGAVLRGEDPVLHPAADARIAVRHADTDTLLPAEDRPYVDLGTGLDQRIARIAGQEGRTLAPENLGDDVGAVHELGSRLVLIQQWRISLSENRCPLFRDVRVSYLAMAGASMRTRSRASAVKAA